MHETGWYLFVCVYECPWVYIVVLEVEAIALHILNKQSITKLQLQYFLIVIIDCPNTGMTQLTTKTHSKKCVLCSFVK